MESGYYKVTAKSGLWLRSGPGTSYAQLALMPEGAIFVADGTSQGEWARGSFGAQGSSGSVTGWAASAYLAPAEIDLRMLADIQAAPALEITGEAVALRAGPVISQPPFGAGSNVITFTHKGEVVKNQSAIQNGFAYVTYKGQDGWMSVLYLKPTLAQPTEGTIAQLPPSPAPSPSPAPPVTKADVIQTEIGGVKGGGTVAAALLLAALGIYYLAK
jgi:hypothetical protein